MKILKLIFENINSYEGKVEIDFTDPGILKGNNQFVICGPMGSGKSTILDAITLALFGSTARLGRLTTSSGDVSKELINKHSGYCKSEVIYSCSKGKYESVFELHKAYDRADGNIRTPQCAIYKIIGDEKSKTLLDSTTTDKLQKKTEEIIGLNYEQFIRCILIPQGEFDRFLTSDEREKAGILAKLSHTEHYRKAAEILNNKALQINREYNELKNRRDAIHVMNDEERKAAEEEQETLKKDISEQEEKLNELDVKINWKKQLEDSENECLEAKNELDKVNSGQAVYEEKTAELKNAKKAEDCEIEFLNLDKCVKEQERVKEDIKNAEAKLKGQNEAKAEAEVISGQKTSELEQKKNEKEKQKELWNKVRELDKEIYAAKGSRDEKKKASDKANSNLEEKRKQYNNNGKLVNDYERQVTDLKEYLDKNSADANLEVTLAAFAEKKKLWKTADTKYIKSCEQEKEYQDKLNRLNVENAALVKERDEISNNLRKLVNSKYLLVAGILRRDLKPGDCCPVCGKSFSPADNNGQFEEHTHLNTDLDGEQEQVATDISNMHDSLEKLEDRIREKEKEISAAENNLNNSKTTAAQAKSEIAAACSEFNSLLKDWNIQVPENVSEKELDDLNRLLSDKNKAYSDNKKDHDLMEKKSDDLKAEMRGINLEELQNNYDEAVSAFNEADDKYRKLSDERKVLFGDQDVDKAEKAFDDSLNEMEKGKEKAKKDLEDIIREITATQASIDGYQKRADELNTQQKELEKELRDKMEKNQFSTKEVFLACRRSKAVISELERDIKDYDTKKTEAETSYNNAKEKHEKIRNQSLTDETMDALNAQKGGLENSKKENSEKIGGLKNRLEQDDNNKKAWNDADAQLQKIGEEEIIYKRINEMLGKKDGSDFEVFVQGIAMRSLLEKANSYLSSIIPKYRLVQKEENSIEFFVYETMGDLTEIKRELSNFSGGEKFIISLSLALAMAEFAGQNGDVECIFLDEGFGTLSGDPLIDAINALKKLSSTGKMLGIITHIEAVIQSFNQIEAVKIGEKSILKGHGVTYTDSVKKTNKK
ncbi:MAG: AAA family ATPase [Lachnospiraceae bacterium]|nr:AAA family ATPase [Lachnospiraceae bacterium]